jgi:PKD repeat protein
MDCSEIERRVTTSSAVPLIVAAPLEVTLIDASHSANGITSYLWEFSDTRTSIEPNSINFYSPEGIYTVTLTVISDSDQDTHTHTEYINVSNDSDYCE